MRDESLTHKDLSAMTGVSETTIKSYRKKFSGFIPVHSRGKPLRFAPEAAQVCKRIRQCFERDLSVNEILLLLKAEFPHLRQSESSVKKTDELTDQSAVPAIGTPPNTAQYEAALRQQHEALNKLIDKCSTLAEAQKETNFRLLKIQESFTDFLSLFLAREDLLGRGLENLSTQLAGHLQHSESGLQTLAQDIIHGLEALREALPLHPEHKSVLVRNSYGDTTRYVFQSRSPSAGAEAGESRTDSEPDAEMKNAQAAKEHLELPPDELLSAPLVVRSEAGEYLGIAGRSEGAFCLNDFIALLQKTYPAPQHFSLEWQKQQTGWSLTAEQAQAIRPIRYALYVESSTTPKGNAVAVLLRLDRNGREQPGPHLYTFIRRMRAMAAAS